MLNALPNTGSVLHALSFNGIRCAEIRHAAHVSLPAHAHEESIVAICLSGQLAETVGRVTTRPRVASVLIRPAGTEHAIEFGDGDQRWLALTLGPDILARYPCIEPVIRKSRTFRSARSLKNARTLIEAIERAEPDALVTRGLVLSLLADVVREATRHPLRAPGWLTHALEITRANPVARHTATSIARRVGMNPGRFARAFGRFMQTSFKHYVLQIRVEEGAMRLIDTGASIADVASDCGFADQAHFTRAFRAIIGTTPGRYVRMATLQ